MFKYIKNLAFLLILLGFFVVTKPVKATNILDFSYTPGGWYGAGCNFNNSYEIELTTNNSEYTAGHNNISKITLRSGSDTSYAAGPRYTDIAIKDDYGNYILATTTINFNFVNDDEFDLIFSSPVPTIVGNKYHIFTNQSAPGTLGDCNSNSCYNVACYFPPYYSYWIKIYYSDNYSYGANNLVTRESPTKFQWNIAGPEVTFSGHYNNDGTYNNILIEILKYGSSPEPTSYLNIIASSTPGVDNYFSENGSLIPGNYAWIASLANNDLSQITTGDAISMFWNFSVANLDGTPVPALIPGWHATNTDDKALAYCDYDVATTSPNGAYEWLARWITDGIRETICYLFIPNRGFLDDLGDATTNIQTKIPFGYISLIGNQLTAIATSSTATTVPAFISQDNYNGLKILAQANIFSYIRTILIYLFVFIAFLYLYKRIRRLIKI